MRAVLTVALLMSAASLLQAQSIRVEPSRDEAWRAVKKGVEADFRPPASSILRTDKVRALARQVTRATPSSSAPSRQGFQTPNAGTDFTQRELDLTDQIRTAQDAYERPPNLANTYANEGTKQPKGEIRLDWDLTESSYLSFGAGLARTDGIIHTGIGPFDIDSGTELSYGKIDYNKNAWHVGAFWNRLDADSQNLLSRGLDLFQNGR